MISNYIYIPKWTIKTRNHFATEPVSSTDQSGSLQIRHISRYPLSIDDWILRRVKIRNHKGRRTMRRTHWIVAHHQLCVMCLTERIVSKRRLHLSLLLLLAQVCNTTITRTGAVGIGKKCWWNTRRFHAVLFHRRWSTVVSVFATGLDAKFTVDIACLCGWWLVHN